MNATTISATHLVSNHGNKTLHRCSHQRDTLQCYTALINEPFRLVEIEVLIMPNAAGADTITISEAFKSPSVMSIECSVYLHSERVDLKPYQQQGEQPCNVAL